MYSLQAIVKKQQETIEMQRKSLETLQNSLETLESVATRLDLQMTALEKAHLSVEVKAKTSEEASTLIDLLPKPADLPALRPKATSNKKAPPALATPVVLETKKNKPEAVVTASTSSVKLGTKAKQTTNNANNSALTNPPIVLGRLEIKDAQWSDAANYERKATFPMTVREREMLREVNMVRMNPKAYIAFVEGFIRDMQKGVLLPNVPIITENVSLKNGVRRVSLDTTWTGEMYDTSKIDRHEIAVAKELIEELRKQKPLHFLEPSLCLTEVAEEQGKYCSGLGKLSHIGSNGAMANERLPTGCAIAGISENLCAGTTSVRQALLQLLIDSKVTGRGHRRNILSPNQTQIGVYETGMFGRYATGWVQEFGH